LSKIVTAGGLVDLFYFWVGSSGPSYKQTRVGPTINYMKGKKKNTYFKIIIFFFLKKKKERKKRKERKKVADLPW
jgi:hypothetical protein